MKVEELIKYTKEITVLYVEDDELIREQTTEFLKKFFKTTTTAVNGQEGLIKFKEGHFDIVITDINMPIKNGVEMIREIKKEDPEQIVIVTSAHNEAEYLIPLINLSVDKFLLKPFDRKVFISVLYKLARSILFEKQKELLEIQMQAKALELKTILNVVDNGIVVVDDGEIVTINNRALELLFSKSVEDAQNVFDSIGGFSVPMDGYIWAETGVGLIDKIKDAEGSYKIMIRSPLGNAVYMFSCQNLDGENEYVLSFSDITAVDNQLQYDQRTKLPNKKLLVESLEDFKKSDEKFLTFLITIENYKSVVKWHGREAGAEMDEKVADVLRYGVADLNLKEEAVLGFYKENLFVIISKPKHKEALEKKIHALEMESSIKDESQSELRKEISFIPSFKTLEFKEEELSEILDSVDALAEKLTL